LILTREARAVHAVKRSLGKSPGAGADIFLTSVGKRGCASDPFVR
jgi:hypothetical protein